MDQFERDLKRNLYKIWNRMSSGTYFPPPVRAVDIPKEQGEGKGSELSEYLLFRTEIAQTVAKMHRWSPSVEPLFHPDSYGYRPEADPRSMR